MNRALAVCALVATAGCSGEDARQIAVAFPRLEVARGAVVYEDTAVASPDGRPWRRGDREFVERFLAPGDRLIVLDDAGAESNPARTVRARVESGTLAGGEYLVGRKAVRPATR